jgi:hypothetical protein
MNPSSNESKPSIIVSGSSWARGEWVGPDVVHDGISQYFADDGYTVIKASQARSYHTKVNVLLEKILAEQFTPGDVIFSIQADPCLDIIMPALNTMKVRRDSDVIKLVEFTQAILEANGLLNLVHNQQRLVYQELDRLAKQHNTIIHCIGGTYNLNTDIMQEFTSLNPLLVSWSGLLVGHITEYAGVDAPGAGASYTWNDKFIDFGAFTPDLAERVRADYAEMTKYNVMVREDIFHPDGLHPNRNGHKILYNYIKQKLDL